MVPVEDKSPDEHNRGTRLPWQAHREADHIWKRRMPTIPAIVGEAAWQGYDADGHGHQSCERLHQRGGFDLMEIGYYIARAVDEGRVRIEVVE